ncbi:MAG: hypothetical protein IPN61_11710 [Bacteroidetes bacterium]|nr:hypothetical protein [Bacteroidota bacterium]
MSEQGPVSSIYLNDQCPLIAANKTNGINKQVTLINSDTLRYVNWHYTLTDTLYNYHASSMIQTDLAFLITGMKAYPGSPELTRSFY